MTEEATTEHEELEPNANDLYNSIHAATFEQFVEDKGYVFRINDDHRALVASEEFAKVEDPEEGQSYDVLVERPMGEYWGGSVRKAEKLAAWDGLVAMAREQAVVNGTFIKANKGGMSVDIGIRAFVPMSHIDLHRVHDVTPYIGRQAQFVVLEFDEEKCQAVVSRRRFLEKAQKEEKRQILDRLEPGEVFEGTVRTIKPYGAFVDIGGGLEGLLHISNMSWGRIDHPSELIRPGDTIKVVLLKYDAKKRRIGLGRKQLLDDPWTKVETIAIEGDTIKGKVVSLADFGAFVELTPGLEGLVHVTELSWTQRINHPSEVLTLGQEINAKIVTIDTEARRIALSVKQLESNPWELVAEKYSAGDRFTGPIRNITDFGIFVELEPGIEGLVHASNLSWSSRTIDPAKEYSVGDELEAMILDIHVEEQRLELGVKQLSDNPWDVAETIAKPGKKIDVTVSRIANYGAFCTIVEGVEGLIHVSEISQDRVEEVSSHLKPGQSVKALVMAFDKDNQRISLSLKRDEIDEEEMRSYADEGSATSTLGDILREKLGIQAEESVDAEEGVSAQADGDHEDHAPVSQEEE